jgi:hypothetical protein
VPTGQAIQDNINVLPMDGLYVPDGHVMHAESEVLPMDGLYDPTGQAMQVVLLANRLYVPALQKVQDVALLPVELLKVPGAQSMQPNPFTLITEPATQKGHKELRALDEKCSL